MHQPIWQRKQEMCDIGRRIWQKGFCAGNEGNHSVRIGGDRYLCTPTGISKGFLEPEDIVVTDGQGRMVEQNERGRRPSSEVKVHLAIYRKREDVGAVIHSHPPHATAFAVAGIPLPEGVHPEAEVFLGKVRTARFAMPSTHDLPESLLPLINEQTNSLLMGNHGSVSFSHTLIDTYYKLEILDAYCRILLLVQQLGKMNTLDPEQMSGLLKIKENFGLSDERLSCAPDGCVGAENDEFLATFDVRPQTAVCDCDGGETYDPPTPNLIRGRAPTNGRPAADASNGTKPANVDEDQFEIMVQTITDQIMANA